MFEIKSLLQNALDKIRVKFVWRSCVITLMTVHHLSEIYKSTLIRMQCLIWLRFIGSAMCNQLEIVYGQFNCIKGNISSEVDLNITTAADHAP